MQERPRVCIIGAGSSGIPVVKAMRDRAIAADCFEMSTQVGGNWCFRNPNGISAAYESLHINTDCRLMEYADYPMSPDTPDYPSHSIIKTYFDDYVDHFGLRERITFGATVTRAELTADGDWRVVVDGEEERRYDALIVANGHHWDPRWPDPPYPGRFDGVQIHSHAYVNPTEPVDCRGRNVLVVGMGNSAMDIACELSRPGLARKLFLSARHGVWILPKYVFGLPLSRMANLPAWMPWWLGSRITSLLLSLSCGKPMRFGLQRPDHRVLRAHPTISQEIHSRLGHGDVLPRPGIAELRGDRVRFTDGGEEPVDVIVWCTGYRVSFPFFDAGFIAAEDNDLPLWARMVRPGLDSLFFVGLLQPLGAIMPIAEAQAKLIADHLAGDIVLPDRATMEQEMARERAAMFARYADRAPRHTMQVDFEPYLARLAAIRRRGRRRARVA